MILKQSYTHHFWLTHPHTHPHTRTLKVDEFLTTCGTFEKMRLFRADVNTNTSCYVANLLFFTTNLIPGERADYVVYRSGK